jgi:arylsulfatase A-like enzyme
LRGDVILQLDWTVGELMKQLKYLGLEKNTIVIFTSDNGPVLDDGYQDEAVAKLNGHTPAGPMRGGKYSALEGGTRVPFIISWPGKIKPKISDALVSQIDILASFSAFFKQPIPIGDATDSENLMGAFLGRSDHGRSVYVEQGGALAIVKNGWKYITPNDGAPYASLVGIETGNSTEPQLYNLNEDIGEKHNLAAQYPEKVKELANQLKLIEQKK